MTRSEAWADLGGGIPTAPEPSDTMSATRSAPQAHVHRFDDLSGWCDCGQRDTGEICPYTPAARNAANLAHGDHR